MTGAGCERRRRRGSVQEQVEQIEGRNHTHAVDKRGALVSRMVLPIPPSITVEMAKGFTLYMLKAVMGGRGDDLIDLAKANL